MMLQFTKMHGLGNDFIVIDAREQAFSLTDKQIQHLADRRLGIGFDQLLVLETSHTPDADYGYRIFNADGSEVGQCGNGARCLFTFCQRRGLCTERLTVKTQQQILTLTQDGHEVQVGLGQPSFDPSLIPIADTPNQGYYQLTFEGQTIPFMALSVGNPHAVFVVDDCQQAPVHTIGRYCQQHASLFPAGINVGFMQIQASDHIKLRVFERGAGETQACGSGAAAAVAAGIKAGQLSSSVTVDLPGGSCRVDWDGENTIYLTGSTCWVYDGTLNLADLI